MKQLDTFVLVPGGWHGGWSFRDLAKHLRARGHDVFALTLTGLGERAHLAHPSVDLSMHIRDVVGVLDAEELTGVILVGHSYGGCVISGVAQLRPQQIRSLVYLDAIVLDDGECLFDHLPEELTARIIAGAEERGHGYLAPTPPMDFLAIGPEHTEWMCRRLTPHPIGTAKERVTLSEAGRGLHRVYVDFDAPSNPATALSKERVRARGGWRVHTIHAGHDAFITHPEQVASILTSVT